MHVFYWHDDEQQQVTEASAQAESRMMTEQELVSLRQQYEKALLLLKEMQVRM